MTDDSPGIPEMAEAETEWVLWSMGSDVDTGGLCDCGHEGLGVSWHTTDCRGAHYALRRKVTELFDDLATLQQTVTRLGRVLADAFDDRRLMADRLAAGLPWSRLDPGRRAEIRGYTRAVDTLRRLSAPEEPR